MFLHLLPTASDLAGFHAWETAVAAFLVLYLVESHTLPHVHGPHTGDEPEPRAHVHLGHFAALGFGIHAVADGLALGAGGRQTTALAATTLVAVLAHKIPEGMALLTLLVQGGFERRRAIFYAWWVALATPVSAVVCYASLGDWLLPVHRGVVLASVAGAFLYVSASDLLPEVRRHPSALESALIVLGVGLMWALRLF